MTDISSLTARALTRRAAYPRCSPEQALAYACEDIVEEEVGSRTIQSRDVGAWVDAVCQREDLDPPAILVARLSRTALASASPEDHSICVRGTHTTIATVLHELAHLAVGVDSHGVLWRDEFTRLTRAHISVSYAALLHSLYLGSGLEMSPWPASAARR